MPTSLPPRPDLGRLMMAAGFVVTPTRFLEACHERCGDYFTLRPTPDRTLVVTVDPPAVREVFTGDPEHLYAGEGNAVLAPILGPRSVLLLDGAEHLRQRRLLLPPFHGERMRHYGALMEAVAARHLARWPRDGTVAALPTMQAITLEVIMRAVLGVGDPERLARFGPPLRRLLDLIASPARVLGLALLPARSGPLSPWGRLLAARRAADAALYAEIAARRALPADERGDDVLSLLLAARFEDGSGLDDDALRDELMTLLVAGHETTASALAWALERIVRTPRVLERLRGGEDPVYLEAVVKETLRLRPVVPAVARRLQVPMSFGGWDLPAGVHIAPSIYLLHRRPDLYPDPLAFRPERWIDGAGAPVRPSAYEWIPFGGGVRRCLGAAFAQYEMTTVLRTVLQQVELRPQPARRAELTTRRAITFAPSRGGRIAVALR